ncbi:hypothetical protein SAMD00019534_125740 [Acytostelium subglobosum LB1]|uniref:hypothetical protein n=1 Tax=Acytostelium subglobosum LB1 TaxID=1410327 RepID=UPI000644932C|nr:hypothetical protein SAMD00019534_125740 [Acytostelium subglobosum LB1]GAM29398.1 hypothetical protein SAMD00019534_125740 [Acytostelium subglobosum LB1]|eukprot:XP_012747666.1 hypothetical protein SAMD00019534_125740 [Acytostelium subglobosum LB1]
MTQRDRRPQVWIETDGPTQATLRSLNIYIRGRLVQIPDSERRETAYAIAAQSGVITPFTHCEKKSRQVLRVGDQIHKVDVSFLKGNSNYYLFHLRKRSDVDNPLQPNYEKFMPWSTSRLLHSGNKEVHPPFYSMKDNYLELKQFFEMAQPQPNENGPSRFNIGGYCWSLEPQNQHNQSGSCPLSALNNLMFEVTTKEPLTEEYYLDFYSYSTLFIQQQGTDIQRVFSV